LVMVLAPVPCSALTVSRSPFKRQVPCPDLFPSKEPSLLYELVKPVFQQIFLPLRSASVIAPARAHMEWPDTTAAKMIGILRVVSTPFLAPRKSGSVGTYHIQEEKAISYEEDKNAASASTASSHAGGSISSFPGRPGTQGPVRRCVWRLDRHRPEIQNGSRPRALPPAGCYSALC
jgi:hypothetical protein